MRKLICFLSISFFLSSFCYINAQDSFEDLPENYKTRHAIYDYQENELTNTDSIPEFASKSNPLKITGTVFLSDGVTPAKDVILYINQADEYGTYKLKKQHDKRYVYHRGWVKTDADGQYTFYTFVPGKERRSNDFKKIHLVIKEPNRVDINGFDLIFDNDPLLTKSCRRKIAKNGLDNILKLEKEETIAVAIKDIVLDDQRIEYAKN